MLKLSNIQKSYPQRMNKKSSALILNELNMTFRHKRTCIIGANGSGKSSLLLIVAGLLVADKGDVLWQTGLQSPNQLKKLTALASDSVAIPTFLSARQVLVLVQETWSTSWPSKLIEQFAFAPHLDKSVDSLSTGSLRKLQLISAFMRQPKVLLLDEPNIALDNQSLQALWSLIEEYPHAIIVASNEPVLFEQHSFAIEPLQNMQAS